MLRGRLYCFYLNISDEARRNIIKSQLTRHILSVKFIRQLFSYRKFHSGISGGRRFKKANAPDEIAQETRCFRAQKNNLQ